MVPGQTEMVVQNLGDTESVTIVTSSEGSVLSRRSNNGSVFKITPVKHLVPPKIEDPVFDRESTEMKERLNEEIKKFQLQVSSGKKSSFKKSRSRSKSSNKSFSAKRSRNTSAIKQTNFTSEDSTHYGR